MTGKADTSNSGIRKLSNGERIIPSSVRADGTVRKEIRVKPGYRPPEDVELYKNRTAEAWKNRSKGGVPGAEAVGGNTAASASSSKNAKRREARKKAGLAANQNDEEAVSTSTEATAPAVPEEVTPEIDPDAEVAKEARKLTKKLRQARELKDRNEQGDSLLPEQFAKVIKIQELIRQLDKLGFDANGEKKEGVAAV